MAACRPVGPPPYTVQCWFDTVPVNATSGPLTVTLPTVIGTTKGRRITIYKIDASANAVTVDADGAQTINGAPTMTLST